MLGHIEVNHSSTMVGKDDKDKENTKCSSGHGEEIDGGKFSDVIIEESTPGL